MKDQSLVMRGLLNTITQLNESERRLPGVFKIVKITDRGERVSTGTLDELIDEFSYTLEKGVSYQHESGNKKIDLKPKTVKSLVSNLNNAVKNAAKNGVPNVEFQMNESVADQNGVEIDEAPKPYRRDSNSWVILPATMELYGRRTVDLITAASTWDEEYIYVCTKDDESRLLFVGSSGDLGSADQVGSKHEVYHDQNGSFKGVYTVVNVVHVRGDQIVSKVNDIGINAKASFAVFK